MSGCFSDPGADLGIERALLSSSSVNVVSGSSMIGRPGKALRAASDTMFWVEYSSRYCSTQCFDTLLHPLGVNIIGS